MKFSDIAGFCSAPSGENVILVIAAVPMFVSFPPVVTLPQLGRLSCTETDLLPPVPLRCFTPSVDTVSPAPDLTLIQLCNMG